jgi:hypothetical protein
MLISRKYTANDWKSLTFKTEEEWQRAVDIFLDRIETRYLIHIDKIIKHRTSGFAVLALDCTLVETLEQFRRGKEKTPGRKVGDYFVAFLTSSSFKKHFDKDKAKMFYKQIRCGLLHQTEAKNSRVKRTSMLPMIAYTKGNKGLIVNSMPFHQELKTVICQYADELRNPKSKKAREAFRAKMDFICGVEKQPPQGSQPANPDPVVGNDTTRQAPPEP